MAFCTAEYIAKLLCLTDGVAKFISPVRENHVAVRSDAHVRVDHSCPCLRRCAAYMWGASGTEPKARIRDWVQLRTRNPSSRLSLKSSSKRDCMELIDKQVMILSVNIREAHDTI